MDNHETWAPAVGGGGKRRRCPPPLKNHENKGFATYSSLWGAFSLCEGISATFSLMEARFRYVGAFLLLFHLIGGLFAMWGLFLACPPPYENFC